MDVTALTESPIVLVDDDERSGRALERVLAQAGYRNITRTTKSHLTVGLCASVAPDLLILDLHMPAPDGFAILDRLGPVVRDGGQLPVIVMTGDGNEEARHRALGQGARDFITKPFDRAETLLRVRNVLMTRALQKQLDRENRQLQCAVHERSRSLAQVRAEIVHHLAVAAEFRDDATRRHTERVGHTSAAIAGVLGMSEEDVTVLRTAATLHDVGKIGIPDSILLKPGALTDSEFDLMKSHTTIGAAILSGSETVELRVAETIALTHHERWDGSGYPEGTSGAEIPIEGRIVAVADVFDALVHTRPYKDAWTVDVAVAEITQQAGRQFDPAVVDAFLELDHAVLAAGPRTPAETVV